MENKKKQLNVRVSPIYHEMLEQEIQREFINGRIVTKADMIEKAIVLLAKEHEEISKNGDSK